MTDETMKDLMMKHDIAINSLNSSVERLVSSQTETNKKLEQIGESLAKQVLISNKLDSIEKELISGNERIHARVDTVEETQKGELGCSSVKLLRKDIDAVSKDTDLLLEESKALKSKVEANSQLQSTYPSTNAIRWGVGIIVAYSITFGTYVTQTINDLQRTDERIDTLLERDIADTASLTKAVNEAMYYKKNDEHEVE